MVIVASRGLERFSIPENLIAIDRLSDNALVARKSLCNASIQSGIQFSHGR